MEPRIRLSEFDRSRLPLLRYWLDQPHVRPWYPDPAANLEWASCPPEGGTQALIEVEHKPIGYVRWQRVSRNVLDSVGLHQVPENSADVDILIGERICTAKGYGAQALAALASYLSERGDIPMIGLTTSKDNVIAQRAFAKAGFNKIAEYSPSGFGDCFLYVLRLHE